MSSINDNKIAVEHNASTQLTPEKEKEITDRIIHRAELAKMARQLKFELGKVNSPSKKNKNKQVAGKLAALPDVLDLKYSHNSSTTTNFNGSSSNNNNNNNNNNNKNEQVSPLKRNIDENEEDFCYKDTSTEESSPTKKYKSLLPPTTPEGANYFGMENRKRILRPNTHDNIEATPHIGSSQNSIHNHEQQEQQQHDYRSQKLSQGSYLPANRADHEADKLVRKISGEHDNANNTEDSVQNDLGADLLMYLASSPYNSMNAAPSSVLKSRDGHIYGGYGHGSSGLHPPSAGNMNLLQTPSRNNYLDGAMIHGSHTEEMNNNLGQSNKNLKQQLQKEVIPMTPLNISRGNKNNGKRQINGNSNKKNTQNHESNLQRNNVFEENEDYYNNSKVSGNRFDENVTEEESDAEDHLQTGGHTSLDMINGTGAALNDVQYMNSNKFNSKVPAHMMISSSPPREFDSPSVYTQLMLFSPVKEKMALASSQNSNDNVNGDHTKNNTHPENNGSNLNSSPDKTKKYNTQDSINHGRRGSDSRNDDQNAAPSHANLLKTPSRPINGPSGSISGLFLPPNSATSNYMMMKTPNTQQLNSISKMLLDSGTTKIIQTDLDNMNTSDEKLLSKTFTSGSGMREFTSSHTSILNNNKLQPPHLNSTHEQSSKNKVDSEQQEQKEKINVIQSNNSANFSMGEYMNSLFSPSPRVPSRK